jgi:hypothetical protein
MKIKTSELTGATLDWAVAKAAGVAVKIGGSGTLYFKDRPVECEPSTNWAQGGPIIDLEEICTKRQSPASIGYEWNAWTWTKHVAKGGSSAGGSGPTPLIAAMRCFCVSKLGDEIEIPEELK